MIISLSELKKFLNVSDTDQDSQLYNCLTYAHAEAEVYCERRFELAMRTEYYATNLQTTLQLRNYPIVQSGVFSLVLHDDLNLSWGADTLLAAEQYQVDEEWGRVVLVGQYFSVSINPAIKNIKVEYGAGYTSATIPSDLKIAIMKLAGASYKKADTYLNAVSGRVENSGQSDDLRSDAEAILDLYKRVR